MHAFTARAFGTWALALAFFGLAVHRLPVAVVYSYFQVQNAGKLFTGHPPNSMRRVLSTFHSATSHAVIVYSKAGGTLLAVGMGALCFGERVTAAKLGCVALIVSGVLGIEQCG